jgi:pimeloyl-ACP methyl ester carboxylesterase
MTETVSQTGTKRPLLRISFALIKMLMAFYLTLLTGLYFFQRELEYIPVTAFPGTPKENGVGEMSVVSVHTADNLSLMGWFAGPKKENGRVVVLFHGQGIHIGGNRFKARLLLDDGYGVFFCEYPGFGGNPGTPTEESIYNDGRAVIQWLKKQGYDESRIILYGESLGSGVAVQMATEFHVGGVILEAPYNSAVAIAQFRYPYFPVQWLMKDPLDSLSKMGGVKEPLLIIHGAEDPVIPIAFSRELFAAAAGPKKFITVDGAGHPPDLYLHGAGKMIVEWLDHQDVAK